MKRKFLLTLFLTAFFALAFIVCASASSIYKDQDGTVLFTYTDENTDYIFDSYTGVFPKTDAYGNELTWYITEKTTENNDTVYKVASKKTLGEAGNINDSGAFSFISPVTSKNVVSVSYPDNSGITAIPAFGSYGTRLQNNILFCYLPNTVTEFPESLFQETPIVVAEIDDETPVTFIPHKMFHEARNIKVVNIPAKVETIKAINSSNGTAFCYTYSLETITFAPNSRLKTINAFAFWDSHIEYIQFPESYVEVDQNLFRGCSNLKVIRFSPYFKGFKNLDYNGNIATNHHSVTHTARIIEEVYIPASFYMTKPDTNYRVSYAFDGCTNAKFFYTGTKAQLEVALANFKNDEWTTGATDHNYILTAYNENKIVTWAEYSENKESYQGRYIITDYNVCDAFYESIHEEDGNTCVINCERCDTHGVMEENPVHIMLSEISYALGYATYGELSSRCTNEGCICASAQISVVNPIFNSFLYSTRENEALGIGLVLSIGIDKDALATYEEISKSSLKYGALAVAGFNIGNDGSAFDNEGKASTGAICAEVSASGVSKLDLVIRGSAEAWDSSFEGASEGQTIKDLPFYVLGFFTDGNGTSYFYGEKSSSTLLDLDTITYNSIN